MKRLLLALVAGAATVAHLAAAVEYQAVADWLKLPAGRPQLGTMHGDIAVSASGEVYVSVEDPQAGLQVYAADGTFIRNVPNAPPDFHGFVIRRLADGAQSLLARSGVRVGLIFGGLRDSTQVSAGSVPLIAQEDLQIVPALQIELVVDVVQVNLDGADADRQLVGNLLIVHA